MTNNRQAAKIYMGPQKVETPKREKAPEVISIPEGKRYPRDVYIAKPNSTKIREMAAKVLELVKDIHFGDDALKEAARNELIRLIVVEAGATVNNAESFVTKILRRDIADSEGSGEVRFVEFLTSELNDMVSHIPSTRFDTRKDKSDERVGPVAIKYPKSQDDSPAELAFMFAPKFVALSQKTGDEYRNALINIVNEMASATAISHESISRFVDKMLKEKGEMARRGIPYFESFLLSAFRRLMRSQELTMASFQLIQLTKLADRLDHAGRTHLANLVDDAIKEITAGKEETGTQDSSGASSEEDFGDELDRRSLRDIPDPAQVEFDQLYKELGRDPTDEELAAFMGEEESHE